MAGDWIPMRTDLAEDPAVIGIADATGLDEGGVVGRLHRLWSWASWHTEDGDVKGVTFAWVNRHVQSDGFAEAMEKVGWLVSTKNGVRFPRFDEWNSQSAKKRRLTARRMASLRDNKRDAASVTKTSPHYITEENIRIKNGVAGGGKFKWQKPSRKALGNTTALMAWMDEESAKAGITERTPETRVAVIAAAERALAEGETPPLLFVSLIDDYVAGNGVPLEEYRKRAEARYREWSLPK